MLTVDVMLGGEEPISANSFLLSVLCVCGRRQWRRFRPPCLINGWPCVGLKSLFNPSKEPTRIFRLPAGVTSFRARESILPVQTQRALTTASVQKFADVDSSFDPRQQDRESDEVDVCIVGGGTSIKTYTCRKS